MKQYFPGNDQRNDKIDLTPIGALCVTYILKKATSGLNSQDKGFLITPLRGEKLTADGNNCPQCLSYCRITVKLKLIYLEINFKITTLEL